ncbi:MAG: hypothetical protein HY885_12735 [Deltaproteobacteria bacterium]|nr:hypothetical protein [Deltaproteobacteria bacterium]
MSTKEKISLLLLTICYLLVTVRYFPNRPLDTFQATMRHCLQAVPFIIGLTILAASLLQKTAGVKLPKNRIVRIYLMFGMIVEFFFGLYHYAYLGQL